MTQSHELVVGFDLDMTLVDSRVGIVRCMQHTLGRRGVTVTAEQLWPLVGAPLEDNLGGFLPEDQVQQAADDYRAAYLRLAIEPTTALPGAHDVVRAIHERGGRVMVVSAKNAHAVRVVLEHVGLRPDVVSGDRFAEQKAVTLREHDATMYVGDHAGDMRAARTAEIMGIGVLTGPHDDATLRAAGADEVLEGLPQLVARLDEFGRARQTR
ncbi:HAD family hydrolase [Leekyejoonella antrihumi]|uniref:HAD family hydrolase n=1 Tax=Leekyejoonella antrihumi TaxID=1660198 RepID=A0A563DTM4_9MICO|nr:HAD family hydrolase [Leekyejoonella antrihumi]TWP33516.1 HAD family hydrolase [Leekyejoonella antrihumi]